MHQIKTLSLWTGQGSPLKNAVVSFDDNGQILEITEGSAEEPYDHVFGMPAFFDAHCHLSWMVLKELSLDLSSVRNASELLDMIREEAEVDPGRFLRGESFDESEWEDPKLPTLKELDSATGGKPVFLCRVCGHAALVNSAMVDIINPESQWINRTTGMIREKPVMEFSEKFPPDPLKIADALSSVVARVHAAGVTGVCSIEKPHNAEMLVNADPELDIAVALNGTWSEEAERAGFRTEMMKFFLDGSLGAGSATVGIGSREFLLMNDRDLLEKLLSCAEHGITPSFHAIGGEALLQLSRVSASAFKILGRGFPIRIEHAEDLLSAWPDSWNPDFHIFSMQPNFVERWQRPGGMYDRIVSPEKSVTLNPFRTVLNAGFRLGFGSDSMPLDPLYGLAGAVTHRDPSQSLSMEEALRAYTLDSASISGNSALAEPLRPGRPADMVFLSSDPFSGLSGVSVQRTLRRGKTVYAAEGVVHR